MVLCDTPTTAGAYDGTVPYARICDATDICYDMDLDPIDSISREDAFQPGQTYIWHQEVDDVMLTPFDSHLVTVDLFANTDDGICVDYFQINNATLSVNENFWVDNNDTTGACTGNENQCIPFRFNDFF